MLYQARAPMIRIGRASVALPPGGFLQAVAEAEAAMAAFVGEALAGAKSVADLYCGVGAFALRLAEDAAVAAYDVAAPAVAALRAAHGAAPGLKAIAAEARDLVRRPVLAAELKRIDAAVIDPPRAGAAEQHRELARSKRRARRRRLLQSGHLRPGRPNSDRRRLQPEARAAGGPVPLVAPC